MFFSGTLELFKIENNHIIKAPEQVLTINILEWCLCLHASLLLVFGLCVDLFLSWLQKQKAPE